MGARATTRHNHESHCKPRQGVWWRIKHRLSQIKSHSLRMPMVLPHGRPTGLQVAEEGADHGHVFSLPYHSIIFHILKDIDTHYCMRSRQHPSWMQRDIDMMHLAQHARRQYPACRWRRVLAGQGAFVAASASKRIWRLIASFLCMIPVDMILKIYCKYVLYII